MDKEKTKVIFRHWRGNVIAIFPEDPGNNDPYTCSSYEHVGQHGACDPQGIIGDSKLATPEEYKDLKNELENQVGYNLQIIKKHTQSHLNTRKRNKR